MNKNMNKKYKKNILELLNKYNKLDLDLNNNLSLLGIIEFGHLEPIYSKFLYWLLKPEYHNKSYKDKYLKEFLKHNNIDFNESSKFGVKKEVTAKSIIQDDESNRRIDLKIEIQVGKKIKTILIENKVNADLIEPQIIQEISFFKLKKNDIFIALLSDLKSYQFFDLKNNSTSIIENIKEGIEFKLFRYSDWLKLNREFKFFDIKECKKIEHLNEGLKKVAKMTKIENFDEDVLLYIKSNEAIKHFEEKFNKQAHRFLNDLREKIINEKLGNGGKFKGKKNEALLLFEMSKKFEININISSQYLGEKVIYIGIKPIEENIDNEALELKLDVINGYDPKDRYHDYHWIEFNIDINNLDNLKKDIISLLKKLKSIIDDL